MYKYAILAIKNVRKQSTPRSMSIKLPEYLYWGYCHLGEQCRPKKIVRKLYWDNLHGNYDKSRQHSDQNLQINWG